MKVNKNFWKNKKVFVTGHTGFKGSWLTLWLKKLGADVSGYSLKPKKKSLFIDANISNGIESNYENILNFGKLSDKIKNYLKSWCNVSDNLDIGLFVFKKC